MIEVSFELVKRDFILFGFLVALLGIGFSYAYETSNPTIFGHSWKETEFNDEFCRQITGKDCAEEFVAPIVVTPPCLDTLWQPLQSRICAGESFSQTSNCGTRKNAIGTKDCGPGSGRDPRVNSFTTPDGSWTVINNIEEQVRVCLNSDFATSCSWCGVTMGCNICQYFPNSGSYSSGACRLDLTSSTGRNIQKYGYTTCECTGDGETTCTFKGLSIDEADYKCTGDQCPGEKIDCSKPEVNTFATPDGSWIVINNIEEAVKVCLYSENAKDCSWCGVSMPCNGCQYFPSKGMADSGVCKLSLASESGNIIEKYGRSVCECTGEGETTCTYEGFIDEEEYDCAGDACSGARLTC